MTVRTDSLGLTDDKGGFEPSLESFPDVERIRGCECTFENRHGIRTDYVTGAMVCADYNCIAIYSNESGPYGYHGKWGGWKWSDDGKDIIVSVTGYGTCTIHKIRPAS